MTTLLRRCRQWYGLAAVVAATTAIAQTEQWLQYHLSSSGQGYRWLELTTNAPAGVALPKLNAQPYFARWTTPLDAKGGRWIVLLRQQCVSGEVDAVTVRGRKTTRTNLCHEPNSLPPTSISYAAN